jgi:hypothetical protein
MDRVRGDAELIPDLGRREPAQDQPHELSLAVGQHQASNGTTSGNRAWPG